MVVLVVLNNLCSSIHIVAIGLGSQLDVSCDWSLTIFAKLSSLKIDLAHVDVGFMIIVALSCVP